MKPSPIQPRYKPPLAAIQLGAGERSGSDTRFGRLLVWFMRFVSVLWILQGLLQWSSMLMGDADGQGLLETMSTAAITAVLFFASIDLIAAVGLWLAAPWGGVVWLVAVAAQWLAILLLPGFLAQDMVVGLLSLGLVIVYFFLTYRAARELDALA